MAFEFRRAKREDVDLLFGLSGPTGSGKTYTAGRLATGMCQALGQDSFAFIDTENGRAKHYADFFTFDHARLDPPFTPARYADAIASAAAAGYKVIVVDSMSHEWAGEGGVLEMQQEEHQRLGGSDNVKLLSWAKPKQEHKRMLNRLLQCRAHVILCHRAESKIEIAKEGNRTVVREKEGFTGIRGYFPVAEKNLAFELTVSLLLLHDRPGVPIPIKLQEQHQHLFPLDQVITEETGAKLVEWAAGGNVDWVARIKACTTLEQLRIIRGQVDRIKARLPESAREIIKTTFNEKLAALKPQAQEGATR
jgi:hypothetical protein